MLNLDSNLIVGIVSVAVTVLIAIVTLLFRIHGRITTLEATQEAYLKFLSLILDRVLPGDHRVSVPSIQTGPGR